MARHHAALRGYSRCSRSGQFVTSSQRSDVTLLRVTKQKTQLLPTDPKVGQAPKDSLHTS
jgi:hypothetical protein